MTDIQRRYQEVAARVRRAALEAGRPPEAVTLVAVSKTFPAEAVLELRPFAPVIIGENRVQEAAAKMDRVADPQAFRWHLIGHLQSNKAGRAAAAFAMIHSVDTAELLRLLDQRCQVLGRRLPVLIEVNTGGEETKYGCREADLPPLLDTACALAAVEVRGLMTVPPYAEDPEQARPYFRRLRQLRDKLAARYAGGLELRDLSMGMSHDFEVAIQEGATLVRVGTAIFGARA